MNKTRFAPSPTGEMHIANLRAAIINWIFAKQTGGKFYIRIEDTDIERSKPEYEAKIFEILNWMKLDHEKEVLKQSERIEIYHEKAKEIANYTYYCICDSLPENKKKCPCRDKKHTEGVLRFKTPTTGSTEYTDMIFGKLSYPNEEIEDFALIRSNGIPTYMFAVVVDDLEMQITHIIRGEDHKTNTFKQILLYKAFNKPMPQFGHLSMIKGSDGQKLSKRNRDASVQSYLDDGYIPDAIFNFLVKLGWGYGNEEIISRERILQIFDITRMKSSPCSFDLKKLKAFSAHYLRENNTYVLNILIKKYGEKIKDIWDKIGSEILKRSSIMQDVYENLSWYLDYAPHKHVFQTDIKSLDINNMDKEQMKDLRLILTNKEVGLNLFDIINILGPAEVQKRISYYI